MTRGLDLRLGMSREEVVTAMGEPDDLGGTSRKYPTPRVFVYGDIELSFQPWKNGGLVAVKKREKLTGPAPKPRLGPKRPRGGPHKDKRRKARTTEKVEDQKAR